MVLVGRLVAILLIDAQEKADDHDQTGEDHVQRGSLVKNEKDKDHVENGGQTATHKVKSDLHVFQAQIVEDNHRNKDQRERQGFSGDMRAERERFGKVDQPQAGRFGETVDK